MPMKQEFENTRKRTIAMTVWSLAAVVLIHVCGATCVMAGATISSVTVEKKYLGLGEPLQGTIVLRAAAGAPGERLRVSAIRTTDISLDPAATSGTSEMLLLEKSVSDLGDTTEVPFRLDAAGVLAGSIRVKAQLLGKDARSSASEAWSDTIDVGIRRRVDLAGAWQVSNVEAYPYRPEARPKDWQPPAPKTVELPGTLTTDEWFRGWMTVHRDTAWTATGDLRPRFLRLSGVNDSALVSVDGAPLPETRPLEEMAVLTHWIEFHSPYKGEENAKTRLMFLDLLPQPPVKLALPKPLDASGKAGIDIRIRGSSGLFKPKPAYGIHGDLFLELAPAVYIKDVSFDTDKPGDARRFHFRVAIANESGKPFSGSLRAAYGHYDGKLPYSGNCPTYASVDTPVTAAPGESVVEITREERPRFETCRATFLLVGADGKTSDADSIDFHTVTFEIRDRRDFYLNNERFLVKGQGSGGDTAAKRWQLRLMGGNAFRGPTDPDQINLYATEGLLTSCGGALLASVEKCAFYNPNDTSNITKAVKGYTSILSRCPGVIIWEATNELHGDPEAARVAILEAFHKLDPYHRPVLATKGSGEWEAEAHNGRVEGVDIVGCQYLLSKEGVDSITAAVTEQPIMSTEVNWNDGSFARDGMFQYWLSKGVAGSLLFDYSGTALDQPVPAVPPPDNDPLGLLIKRGNREMYQDLVATAEQQADGSVLVRIGNQMPYTIRQLHIRMRGLGGVALPDLDPGGGATLTLPKAFATAVREAVIGRAEYVTHSGLPHVALLTPIVTAAPASTGGAK